ncbi:MAG: hypothetical protein Q9220_002482 [cf. Caloplaca sp. 1 TL-2023]
MFAARLPCLPTSSRQCIAVLQHSQRRWAQVHDVRFLVTNGPREAIAEKYRDKLQRKALAEGLRSVDELKTIYKNGLKKQPGHGAPNHPTLQHTQNHPTPQDHDRPPSSPPPASSFQSSPPHGLKTLSSYVDLPKVATLPPKEIEYLWRLRHAASSNSLCAVVPSSTYHRIHQMAQQHPQFILPLPREGSSGAEVHFLQWSFPAPHTVTVVFTHLAEYKLRGEFSQPHTTVTMHEELMHTKGLVLMQGQVMEGRGVDVEGARWLLLCLQKFYGAHGTGDSARRKLLAMFSMGDEAFKLEDLIDESEKLL